MTVIVVGAGIAGLACATELTGAGVAVRVLERGRVVGGRLASRRFGGRPADIGAAYFTVDDADFAALVGRWEAGGLARPWTDTLLAYEGTPPPHTTSGPMRWAAPGGLRSLAEDLATGLDVELEHPVASVDELAGADAVVLAMPGPQAARLLASGTATGADTGTGARTGSAATRAVAEAQVWQPVLAAVLAYPRRSWADFAGAFVNDHPVLATVFDDGDRRGDGAPVLVAHSTPGFAGTRLDDPPAAGADLERAVRELLALPDEAESVHVHRWTYAQPAAPGTGGPAFHEADGFLLAGDAFGKPRVQTAWLSGRAAGRALAARLSAVDRG